MSYEITISPVFNPPFSAGEAGETEFILIPPCSLSMPIVASPLTGPILMPIHPAFLPSFTSGLGSVGGLGGSIRWNFSGTEPSIIANSFSSIFFRAVNSIFSPGLPPSLNP